MFWIKTIKELKQMSNATADKVINNNAYLLPILKKEYVGRYFTTEETSIIENKIITKINYFYKVIDVFVYCRDAKIHFKTEGFSKLQELNRSGFVMNKYSNLEIKTSCFSIERSQEITEQEYLNNLNN